uniref:hypothetical protein n=1 Tax=Streptomyces chartreusis TaxID=1969 RepID=UPI003F494B3B
MFDKARRLFAEAPVIACRQDALEAIELVRRVVEEREWQGAGGAGSDQKNLIARLALCEIVGELDSGVSAAAGRRDGLRARTGQGSHLRGRRHGPLDILDQTKPMRTSALSIRSARTTVQVHAWRSAPTE